MAGWKKVDGERKWEAGKRTVHNYRNTSVPSRTCYFESSSSDEFIPTPPTNQTSKITFLLN